MDNQEIFETLWNLFKEQYGENFIVGEKLESLMDNMYMHAKKKLCHNCGQIKSDVELRKITVSEQLCEHCGDCFE